MPAKTRRYGVITAIGVRIERPPRLGTEGGQIDTEHITEQRCGRSQRREVTATMSNNLQRPDAQVQDWTPEKKLSRQQRADLAFRYYDWLLTKNIPSGGFRLLYAISQRFTEENPYHCFPSIEYLAARIGRSESAVWEMLPKLAKIGAIAITWGSRGSKHPNTYTLPAAFLEFYFGPSKGRHPQLALVPKKPRPAGVSKAPKTPVQPPENPGLPDEKPRPAGVNHLLYTEIHKSAAKPRTAVQVDKQTTESRNSSAPDGADIRYLLHEAREAYALSQTQAEPLRTIISDALSIMPKSFVATHITASPSCKDFLASIASAKMELTACSS
jgi:hypothetical protein